LFDGLKPGERATERPKSPKQRKGRKGVLKKNGGREEKQ